MSTLPTGTVTFLFTDIEGSTKLAQGHPDKWETLRGRHNAILQSAVDGHNGHVFQIIGDAFCVAFHTAGEAIHAAVKSQTDLYAEDWGEIPIRVRMGIHTGTAQAGEDSDRSGGYTGYTSMARVQRLMSAAHGGQVLISLSTAELVRDDLPGNVSLRDMGERRLKDLIRPERIYQLVIPDLPVDFPALKTLDAYRNNLPIQMTSFIGREKEMSEIKDALAEHRLVTLTGSGGAGKTRLSLQVAADSLDQFPNGVWFVELAPITDPNLIAQTILTAAGMQTQPARSPLDSLTDFLREKTSLLVLDNCEHIIEACAKLAETLLNAAPNLKILASSREALGIKGEQTWHVPSLSIPDLKKPHPLDGLSQYEAVRLFIDRALLVQPHFSVTNENAPAVAQICYRLDGIPLAIELAAAKIRVLSVEQIAQRLDDRFRLLTGGSRSTLERHQTLHATIDWSYNLLPPAEQMLFRRLAIFVGGWTLEAAEAVCGDISAPDLVRSDDVLNLMEQLINKSIILKEEYQQGTRYRMLETMRQYANEKLVESPEYELISQHHFDFFLKFAESAEPCLKSAEASMWLKRIELEHNNLRTALQWSLDAGVDSGLRLAGALFWFWYLRGYWREGHNWAENALMHSEAQARTEFRAQALFVLGAMAWNLSDFSTAHAMLAESLGLSRAVGEKWWMMFALLWIGWERTYQRDLIAARSFFEEGLALARELEDDWMMADLLRSLGALISRSDARAARPLLEESLGLWRKIGDPWGLAWGLISLGNNSAQQGDNDQAEVYYEESATLCRDMEDIGTLANTLQGLSIVLLAQGNTDRAEAKLLESLVLGTEVGSYELIGRNLVGLGCVAASRGQAERAARLLATGESVLNAHDLSVSVWPNLFAVFDLYVASARSQMDEARFNKAWLEGTKMTMEQAVAFAREEYFA